MKIGIYISGLGQSFVQESVEKYAARLMNEMSYRTNGINYELRTEKINYAEERESTVVSIFEEHETGAQVVYKIYDYKYHEILTEKFNSHSIIVKNFLLFLLVIQKIPLIFKRLFDPKDYSRPFQSLYVFMIFLTIASSVLLMLPATLAVVNEFFKFPLFPKADIEIVSKLIVSLTAVLLLILPNANVLITNLATEYVCANDYIEHGVQKQLLQGNLELLVDYISEKEKNCRIHFHTYSFGSIIAIDYIFPFGNTLTRNTLNFTETLITIGTPFEFIKAYYPRFYDSRNIELGDKICWINIYSIADPLATNFRSDAKIGDAQFGIDKTSIKPVNLNYEVAPFKKTGIVDFIMLYSMKAHGMYWDSKTEGQSCLRLLNDEMKNKNLL
ncbi:MAG: hypothetical protein GZ094_22720 [Mariniphaga sp.]|nr:hypothetical protein [Mariniphaga sp.]